MAVQFVLDPDSDLSDLSHDEDQDITMKNIPTRIRDEQEESNDGEKLAENIFIDKRENKDEDGDKDGENENVVNTKTCEKFEPRWRTDKPPTPAYTFKGQTFSLPPDDVDTWTPLSHFKMIQIQQAKSKHGIIKVKHALMSIVRQLYKSIINQSEGLIQQI